MNAFKIVEMSLTVFRVARWSWLFVCWCYLALPYPQFLDWHSKYRHYAIPSKGSIIFSLWVWNFEMSNKFTRKTINFIWKSNTFDISIKTWKEVQFTLLTPSQIFPSFQGGPTIFLKDNFLKPTPFSKNL